MGIMKNELIEKLIEDEKTSEVAAQVELLVDLARERERDRIQMDMYDDPHMNWSGHR